MIKSINIPDISFIVICYQNIKYYEIDKVLALLFGKMGIIQLPDVVKYTYFYTFVTYL